MRSVRNRARVRCGRGRACHWSERDGRAPPPAVEVALPQHTTLDETQGRPLRPPPLSLGALVHPTPPRRARPLPPPPSPVQELRVPPKAAAAPSPVMRGGPPTSGGAKRATGGGMRSIPLSGATPRAHTPSPPAPLVCVRGSPLPCIRRRLRGWHRGVARRSQIKTRRTTAFADGAAAAASTGGQGGVRRRGEESAACGETHSQRARARTCDEGRGRREGRCGPGRGPRRLCQLCVVPLAVCFTINFGGGDARAPKWVRGYATFGRGPPECFSKVPRAM